MDPTTEPAIDAIGVIGDRYEIEAHLGTGGMGTVYRAYDRDVGETVALKLMRATEGLEPLQIERFRREVRLARRVTHPNAARIYDLGHDGDRWYLTMELLVGESLAQRLAREGKLEPGLACRIAADICAGLEAIHEAGVVHRDLKPANVLVCDEEEGGERIVVTDFGIAKALDCSVESLTRGVIGTPGYMAPEQAMGSGPVDARSDLYALGTILFVMLCGRHPSEHGEPLDPREPPVWPPQLDAAVPEPLAKLVAACLARPPHQRPTSARAVEQILRSLAPEPDQAEPLQAGLPRSEDHPTTHPATHPAAGKRVLSILPFRKRGHDDDDIATTITEELIDLLSRSRELWVTSFGATERFIGQRDPQLVGRELGADFVVDGTVQRRSDRLRISIQLIETVSGRQIWSERLDGELDDVFELQDQLAQTIAEHLRVELLIQRSGSEPSSEALSKYLSARELIRQGPSGARDVYSMLADTLAAEPRFASAVTLRALAALNSWFYSSSGEDRAWEARVVEAIAAADSIAPEASATQQAIGLYALQCGRFSDAVQAFRRALGIAPTNPIPTYYLGLLDLETGRIDRGRTRLKLAHSLSPMMELPVTELARVAALLGDDARYQRWMTVLEGLPGGGLPHAGLRLRVAAWRGDLAVIRGSWREVDAIVREYGENTGIPELYAAENGVDEPLRAARVRAENITNGRFRALVYQMLVEVACLHDRPCDAVELLERALEAHLLDVTWLERCQLLEPLREQPQYPGLHERLSLRVASLWGRTTGESVVR